MKDVKQRFSMVMFGLLIIAAVLLTLCDIMLVLHFGKYGIAAAFVVDILATVVLIKLSNMAVDLRKHCVALEAQADERDELRTRVDALKAELDRKTAELDQKKTELAIHDAMNDAVANLLDMIQRAEANDQQELSKKLQELWHAACILCCFVPSNLKLAYWAFDMFYGHVNTYSSYQPDQVHMAIGDAEKTLRVINEAIAANIERTKIPIWCFPVPGQTVTIPADAQQS